MLLLQALVYALPELLPIIQTHLLDLLSLGLTRKPYRDNLSTAASHSLTQAIQLGRLLSDNFVHLFCAFICVLLLRLWKPSPYMSALISSTQAAKLAGQDAHVSVSMVGVSHPPVHALVAAYSITIPDRLIATHMPLTPPHPPVPSFHH